MSRYEIPKKVIVTCDNCKVTSDTAKFKMRARVNFHGSGLDIYGDPAASADFSFDLCDKCAVKFYNEWRGKAK